MFTVNNCCWTVIYLAFNQNFHNNLARNLQLPVQTLLRCAAMCDQSCHCFGFNTHTNTCRAFKTCDHNEVIGIKNGWIYFLKIEVRSFFSSQCTDQQAFKTLITCDKVFFIYLFGVFRPSR